MEALRSGLLLPLLSLFLVAPTPSQEEHDKEPWKLPCSGGLTLRMTSDYIHRSLNLSEPGRGESPEKANYDLTLCLSTELERWTGARMGSVGGLIWWKWYAGMKLFSGAADTDAGTDVHLQQVNYALSWTCPLADLAAGLEPAGAVLTLGWMPVTFPHLRGHSHATTELFGTLRFDDRDWYGLAEPLLSPRVTLVTDCDDADGSWLEAEVGHSFKMADCPLLGGLPLFSSGTVRPSFLMGWDMHMFNSDTSRLASMVYGVTLSWPLGELLHLPEGYGLELAGFIKFSDAKDPSTGARDVLYGGVSLGFRF